MKICNYIFFFVCFVGLIKTTLLFSVDQKLIIMMMIIINQYYANLTGQYRPIRWRQNWACVSGINGVFDAIRKVS